MIFSLILKVTQDNTDLVTGLLAVLCTDGWQERTSAQGETEFQIFSANLDHLKEIEQKISQLAPNTSVTISEQQEEDWLETWKKNFQPVLCGEHFVVLPPWLQDQEDFANRIRLIIEPNNAFGTGQHETTALCLSILSKLAQDNLIKKQMKFLDLGTGSGILAIAACKLGLSGIGLDIDQAAIDNAKKNAALNNVTQFLQVSQGSLTTVSTKHFDLVFANILANPLITMAKDLTNCLAPNGILILSGLLTLQAENVINAYTACGLNHINQIDKGEWTALYAIKKSTT